MEPTRNDLQQNQQFNPQMQQPVTPPEPQYQFRWATLVGTVIVVLIFLWMLDGIQLSFTFKDIMNYVGIIHQQKFRHLTCLCIVLIAMTLIWKSLRNNSR